MLHPAVDFISILNCESMNTLDMLLLANGNLPIDKSCKVITAVITQEQMDEQMDFVDTIFEQFLLKIRASRR